MTEALPQAAVLKVGRRAWRIAARLALVLVAALVALKVGDVIVGWSRDTEMRHRLRLVPNVELRHQSDEFDYTYRTNRLGLRGPAPDAARTPNSLRIAVVGDSFVAGYGVADEDLLTTQLEKQLTARLAAAGDDRTVEVINVGRPGGSTIRELELYSRTVRQLKPDWIVLAYFLGNDLAEVVEELDDEELANWHPPGRLRRVAHTCFPSLYLELAMWRQARQDRQERAGQTTEGTLAELRAAAQARGTDPEQAVERYQTLPAEIRQSLEQGRLLPWRVFHGCIEPQRMRDAIDPEEAFFSKAWPRAERHLDKFRVMAEADGARLALVAFPAGCQVDPAVAASDQVLGYDIEDDWLSLPGKTQTALADWAQESDTPYLDLTDDLRNAAEPLYFPLDGHWNPAGHKRAATALAKIIGDLVADGEAGNR